MRTLQQLMNEVSDNLQLEGVTPPDSERLVTLVNRGKNEVVAQLELLNYDNFVVRKSYSVAAGDASIALPDGTGADAGVKRIVGLDRTDLPSVVPCTIHANWQRYDFDDANNGLVYITRGELAAPTLYREGNTLYFTRTGGSAEAMTLLLRYVGYVADLTTADTASSFTLIPEEWTDEIVTYATLLGLPASNVGRSKWTEIWRLRQERMNEAMMRPVQTGPARVQYDDGG